MRKETFRVCVFGGVCVAALLVVTGVSRADIAYSNLGPNDEFGGGGGATILIGDFSATTPNMHYANQFTSEASGIVSTVDVAVSLSDQGDNDFLQILIFDDSGNRPGSIVWSGTIQPEPVAEVVSVASDTGSFEVFEGNQYWVSARALDGTGTYLWYGNALGAEGRFTFDGTGGTDWRPVNEFVQQAFRVNLVTSVPEPSSVTLLPILGCLALRRKRR